MFVGIIWLTENLNQGILVHSTCKTLGNASRYLFLAICKYVNGLISLNQYFLGSVKE
jgi:hypothetical protein